MDEEHPAYEMFGALGDGVTDDTEALVRANAFVARRGGGTVFGRPEATYLTTREVRAGRGVRNLLNGAEIKALLREANDAGVSLSTGAAWIGGTISVISLARPGSQLACHAAVRAGPLVGDSPIASAPDPQEGISDWLLEDLVLQTDAAKSEGGRVAVQIIGGTHRWVCRRLSTPDSDVMAGFIHADWSVVGPIEAREEAMNANLRHFAARPQTGWTTHPHDGLVEDCHAGALSKPGGAGETGSDGIRLSACHDITVRRCRLKVTTFAGLRIVGGDLGFEFALPPSRQRADKGLIIDGLEVVDARGGNGAWIDMRDDNLERAADRGLYRRVGAAVQADLLLRGLIMSSSSSDAGSGIRLDNTFGARLEDSDVSGFRDGVMVEHGCREIAVVNVSSSRNRRHGIIVEHPLVPPERVSIKMARLWSNGLSEAGEHVYLGHCRDTTIEGGVFGDPGHREGVRWSVRIAFPQFGNRIEGEPVFRRRSAGAANIHYG
ncbi:MAG: hypothetical protein Q8K99_10855 [Actinomycetota bacterium]|nr:hypothetical protein [Actinomycetota bacterium]